MGLWQTDLRVPASVDAAFDLEDRSWRQEVRAYASRERKGQGVVELDLYAELLAGQVSSAEDADRVLRARRWTPRTQQLLTDLATGTTTDFSGVLGAARAEVHGVAEATWAAFATWAHEQIAAMLDPEGFRRGNTALLNGLAPGEQLGWWQLGSVFVLSGDGDPGSDELLTWLSQYGARFGTLVLEEGGDTVMVHGLVEIEPFVEHVRELSSLAIRFEGGGVVDAPAAGAEDQDDPDRPPATLDGAWAGPWRSVFESWLHEHNHVLDCISMMDAYAGAPDARLAATIWEAWVAPDSSDQQPLAGDVVDAIAAGMEEGRSPDLFDRATAALWQVVDDEYRAFVGLYS